ncbi:MAG TPA: YfiR family protein, partial [Magnetospirillaceae bacterium]|nr:YfiR family protein [Magnetospirillaceae bacterium]
FAVCVAGRDPFGALLDRAIAGQSFGGRAETVRRLRDTAEAAGCQILYVASSDPLTLRQTADAVRGRPVLIVTDGVQEADARGMINFLVIDDRVRFTIDDDTAAASGLDISSKLLSLAVSVRHKGVKE